MTPGQWLRAQRLARGLNQYQLADLCRCSQGTISQFENDRFPTCPQGEMPMVSLERLSMAVGATPTALRERVIASTLPTRKAA